MQIKTHKMNQKYPGDRFYILSKGNNAGMPLFQPRPNCFVFLPEDGNEKDFYYWLCYGLWQGGYFRKFLTGSVIPFLKIDDLKEIIRTSEERIGIRIGEFREAIDMFKTLEQHQENIMRQLQLIKEARKALMYKMLK